MSEGSSSPSGPEREPPPETLAPAEAKVEMGTAEKPTTETEQPPKQEHAVETYTVGIPGEKKLVADTATGDQVGVRRFQTGDVNDVKRTVIEEGEEAALQSLEGKSPEEKGAIAKGAVESSKVYAGDMAEISKLLEGKRDTLLVVDAATIKDESIPKEGLHLLIPKGELGKVKPRLEELGYSTKEIEQMGLEAEKGRSRFVFLYAKERGEKTLVDLTKETRISDFATEQEKTALENAGKMMRKLIKQSGDDSRKFLQLISDASEGRISVVENSKHLEAMNRIGLITEGKGLFDNKNTRQFHFDFYNQWLKAAESVAQAQDEAERKKYYKHPDSESLYDQKFNKRLLNDPELKRLITAARDELAHVESGIFLSSAGKRLAFHEGSHAIQDIAGLSSEDIDPNSLDRERNRLLMELQVGQTLVEEWKSGSLTLPEDGDESILPEAKYFSANFDQMKIVIERMRNQKT